MAKILPLREVRARLKELVVGVQEREDEVIVTRKGKPAAMLINYAEYERLKDTLDILSDPEMMRQIRASEAEIAAGKKGLSFEEVFGEPLVRRKSKKCRPRR